MTFIIRVNPITQKCHFLVDKAFQGAGVEVHTLLSRAEMALSKDTGVYSRCTDASDHSKLEACPDNNLFFKLPGTLEGGTPEVADLRFTLSVGVIAALGNPSIRNPTWHTWR